MIRIETIRNLDECRDVWRQLMPQELVSDLWEVRDCFNRYYQHPAHFVVAHENGRLCGLLPMSWNRETGQYTYFPGETWEGKTWLEQNRIIAESPEMLEAMLAVLRRPYQLRYLRTEGQFVGRLENVDEIGYLFLPSEHEFSVDKYLEAFSHKTAKKLRKELAHWDEHDVHWRINDPDDFELLIQMNRSRFGRLSYFDDERFLGSFRAMENLLQERGWLRIVAVIVDGEPAAIDMGSLYRDMLTMLAGGTSEAFPGIAKLINMHHIAYACENRLDSVDFLCGDFNWKTLFHLTPVPLYVLQSIVSTGIEKTVPHPLAAMASVTEFSLDGVSHG
ncbi:MAG TPA: GNAT family N-acetyltransferase [candidate division Zixibacteria bacterium]|nr:GNAT family N-acetyltransferase [candidate division Zixibacteria bacterium]